MPEPLAGWLLEGLRWTQPLVLLSLAVFFGRTLRAGATPLIEQIARRSHPALPSALSRYTRRLTALWCGWFVVAAAVSAIAQGAWGPASAVVWAGTLVLFVGERWVRPWLFPGESFPGLVQQLRDTWAVWQARG